MLILVVLRVASFILGVRGAINLISGLHLVCTDCRRGSRHIHELIILLQAHVFLRIYIAGMEIR